MRSTSPMNSTWSPVGWWLRRRHSKTATQPASSGAPPCLSVHSLSSNLALEGRANRRDSSTWSAASTLIAKWLAPVNAPMVELDSRSDHNTSGGSSDSALKELAESFSAQMTYKTRDAVVLARDLAYRSHMQFRITSIPVGYPAGNFLDFSRPHIRQLFSYGESCAAQGLLWTSVAKSIERNVYYHIEAAPFTLACPASAPSTPVHPLAAKDTK